MKSALTVFSHHLNFLSLFSNDKRNRQTCSGHKEGGTMKTISRQILCLGVLFAASACAVSALASDRPAYVTKKLSLPGTNSHGANYFNGEVITRYDNAAPYLTEGALQFWQNFFVVEVGALDSAPYATDGSVITEDTPRSTLMATIKPVLRSHSPIPIS